VKTGCLDLKEDRMDVAEDRKNMRLPRHEIITCDVTALS